MADPTPEQEGIAMANRMAAWAIGGVLMEMGASERAQASTGKPVPESTDRALTACRTRLQQLRDGLAKGGAR